MTQLTGLCRENICTHTYTGKLMLIKFKLYLCIVPVCTTYDKLVKHSLHNEQYIGYLYVEFAVYGYGVCVCVSYMHTELEMTSMPKLK